jgi:hypothetical protein
MMLMSLLTEMMLQLMKINMITNKIICHKLMFLDLENQCMDTKQLLIFHNQTNVGLSIGVLLMIFKETIQESET